MKLDAIFQSLHRRVGKAHWGIILLAEVSNLILSCLCCLVCGGGHRDELVEILRIKTIRSKERSEKEARRKKISTATSVKAVVLFVVEIRELVDSGKLSRGESGTLPAKDWELGPVVPGFQSSLQLVIAADVHTHAVISVPSISDQAVWGDRNMILFSLSTF